MTLSSHAQDATSRAELAPTGMLRVGLVEAPSAGLIFVCRAADGGLDGVTADLSADLARQVGLPLAVTLFPNSGAAAAALEAAAIDVSFMPVDATRRQVIDFGPGYYDLESTYLVSAGLGITDVVQVDRPGLRVVAIEGTTTFRASARTLTRTQPRPRPVRGRGGRAYARRAGGRLRALARHVAAGAPAGPGLPHRGGRLPADAGRGRRSEGPPRRPCLRHGVAR
ncbi:transporter substrate-binding domain-containing protein [Methylobacterium oryzae CBMB20]